MPFRFATLQFEEIVKRLLKSGHDLECFIKLVKTYYKPQDQRLNIDKYKKSGKQEKEQQLIELSRMIARNHPQYTGYDYHEVVLDAIYGSDEIPVTWRNRIFGHGDNEEDLCTLVEKVLKRNEPDCKVFNTSDLAKRSRAGIRWADLTLVKKKTFGGYELRSFDTKVNYSAFKYFLNQAQNIASFSDYIFLVCTPGFVLELAKKDRMRPVQAEQNLGDSLKRQGIGLYVIDIESRRLEPSVSAAKSKYLDEEHKNRALRELEIL